MPTTYEPIATTTATSFVSSFSFTNISQAYTDLVLVCQSKLGTTTTTQDSNIRVNGLSTTIYSDTRIYAGGSGNGIGYDNNTSDTWSRTGITCFPGWGIETKVFMNYTNTSINKPILSYSGAGLTSDANTYVGLWTSVARTTNAITQIDMLSGQSKGWASGTTVTLYGILKA
jgi:hypothetical protein